MDSCAKINSTVPLSGVTDSGRIWRKVPESDARSVDRTKKRHFAVRAQELCESGGGRPGLPSLKSLVVSVDVKQERERVV